MAEAGLFVHEILHEITFNPEGHQLKGMSDSKTTRTRLVGFSRLPRFATSTVICFSVNMAAIWCILFEKPWWPVFANGSIASLKSL